jgi:hypothetical protein
VSTSGDILLIGYPGDPTAQHVFAVANAINVPLAFLDIMDLARGGGLEYTSDANGGSAVCADGSTFRFDSFAGIYQRPFLPNRECLEEHRWAELASCVAACVEILSCCKSRVVNRPFDGWENGSKPLQTLLMTTAGLPVPPSIATSMLAEYRNFAHIGETVYKSNSAVRSIVNTVSGINEERWESLANCPVYFQKRIIGPDVRIHLFRGEVFAVKIHSDAVDYRYWKAQGTHSRMEPFEDVPQQIVDACRRYAQSRCIALAGFDFKIDAGGNWYCLEMNPMPGFDAYDRVLDCRIATRLLQWLRSGE